MKEKKNDWTPELIKQCFDSFMGNHMTIEFIEQFKASKTTPEKDWEVLDYLVGGSQIISHTDGISFDNTNQLFEMSDSNIDIHSVRYRDTVFTVGDMTEAGKIESFEQVGERMYIKIVNDPLRQYYHVGNLTKLNPIFTTNGDSEPVFEGENYYTINGNGVYEGVCKLNYSYDHTVTRFKSREKAEEYLIENAEVLSIKELLVIGMYGTEREFIGNVVRKKIGL